MTEHGRLFSTLGCGAAGVNYAHLSTTRAAGGAGGGGGGGVVN